MRNDQLLDRVRGIVATIFDVPQQAVTAESSPDNIERWDSLGRLVLTVELEQEFGIEVPPEQAEQLTSVGAIVDWLKTVGEGEMRIQSSWAQ
jgi:acyl carrier protein